MPAHKEPDAAEPDDDDLQAKFEATDFITNAVKSDTVDYAALVTFIDRAQGYVALIAALVVFLGIRSTAVPGILFIGESLPLRLGRGLGVIAKGGTSTHISLHDTFAAILNAHGDAGAAVRALLGATAWKDACSVGRAAILLRLAVEHRRGFALPRLSMADIAHGAAA